MKHMTKTALLALLTAACIVSCGDSSDGGSTAETTAAVGGSNTGAVTEDPALQDSLPDTDLDGWTYRMCLQGETVHQEKTYVDGESGSIVNDAVYDKIRTVEERFNVDIIMTEDSHNSADNLDNVKNMILAGDDFAEILQGHDISMANLAMEGYFINVYDIPHLDFTKPWWSKATLDSMTVADQMYMMFNNISYCNLSGMRALYFNKTLLQAQDITFPYEEVLAGTWTLDRLLELSAQGYKDLNGDGKTDENDQFGFINPTVYYCFFEPFQVEPYCKDKNGNLYYEVNLEKLQTLTEKFYDLLFTQGGYLAKATDVTVSRELTYKAFTEDRAMFIYTDLTRGVQYVSDSEAIYGLLPMPKFDEKQDTYYGGSTDRPIAVPITASENLDAIGLVSEALNAEGYKQVYPAYYEVAMKSRYADQTEDAQMLDLIHDNVIISFTYLNGNYKSIYNIMLENLFNASSPTTDVASWCAKNEKTQIAHVEKLQEFFDENRP